MSPPRILDKGFFRQIHPRPHFHDFLGEGCWKFQSAEAAFKTQSWEQALFVKILKGATSTTGLFLSDLSPKRAKRNLKKRPTEIQENSGKKCEKGAERNPRNYEKKSEKRNYRETGRKEIRKEAERSREKDCTAAVYHHISAPV